MKFKKCAGIIILVLCIILVLNGQAWSSKRDDVVNHAIKVQTEKWHTDGYILMYTKRVSKNKQTGLLEFTYGDYENWPVVATGDVKGIPYSLSTNNTGNGTENTFDEYFNNHSDYDRTLISGIYTYSGSRISAKHGASCATFVTDCLMHGLTGKGLSKRTTTRFDYNADWSQYITRLGYSKDDYGSLKKGDYLDCYRHVMLVINNDKDAQKLEVIEQAPRNYSDQRCPNRRWDTIRFPDVKGEYYVEILCMRDDCEVCSAYTLGTARRWYSYADLNSETKNYYWVDNDKVYDPYYAMRVKYDDDNIPPPTNLTFSGNNMTFANESYSASCTASGSNIIYSISKGALPAGLTLNSSTGQITGYASNISYTGPYEPKFMYSPIPYAFTVKASNSGGSIEKEFTINVWESPRFNKYDIEDGTLGADYYQEIIASGTESYMGWVKSGNLPEGLTIETLPNNRVVKITGIPTKPGEYTFTLTLRNGIYTNLYNAKDIKQQFTINIPEPEIDCFNDDNYTEIIGSLPCLYTGKAVTKLKFSVNNFVGSGTYSVEGSLPPGVSLSSNGYLTGTPSFRYTKPTQYDMYNFKVVAKLSRNSLTYTIKKDYSLTVIEKPIFSTNSTLPSGTVGQKYETTIDVTGSGFGMSLNLTNGNLPDGLKLENGKDRWQKKITGIPSRAGTYTFTVKASNHAELPQTTTSRQFIIIINGGGADIKPTIVTSATLPSGTKGVYYSTTLYAAGTAPITWTKTDGSLSDGLTLYKDSGKILGTPKIAGKFSFTVQASNSTGKDTRTFTININENITKPTITTQTLPNGERGKYYEAKINFSGTSPITWQISNNLPSGLSFKEGTISGTPLENFKGKITITASNSAGSDSKTYSLEIKSQGSSSLEVNNKNFPDKVFRDYLSEKFDYNSDSYLSDEEINDLTKIEIDNMNISSLQGIEFLTALTSLKCSNNKLITLDVSKNTVLTELYCSNNQLTNLDVSKCKSLTCLKCDNNKLTVLNVSQNTALKDLNCSYNKLTNLDVSKNTALTSLNFSHNQLTIFTIAISALTDLYCDNNKLMALDIMNNPPLKLFCAESIETRQYVENFTASKDSSGYYYINLKDYIQDRISNIYNVSAYDVSDKAANVEYNKSTGIIKFSSNADKIYYDYDIGYRWSFAPNMRNFLYVRLVNIKKPVYITSSDLPAATRGENYSITLQATGTTPITWSKISGNLPDGLALLSIGKISGIPTKTGNFSFTVKASNSAGYDTRTFTINVNEKPSITTSAILPSGTKGESYSVTLQAAGTKPITWAITANKLPDGLTLDKNSGKISGTPTRADNFSFTVKASNSAGYNNRIFSINIKEAPKPLTINGDFMNGIVSENYSDSVKIEGGTAPYTWTVLNGTVPSEANFKFPAFPYKGAALTLSGTPQNSKTYNFTLQVKDSNNQITTKICTLKINPAPVIAPKITTTSLPEGIVNQDYTAQITVTGTTPITYSMTGSVNGLKINQNTGAITGKPLTEGRYEVTITAENSAGSDSKKFSYVIKEKPTIMTLSPMPAGTKGEFYSETLKADGTTPITWEITENKLPDGLTLNKDTGKISGTPTQTGTFDFSVVAANTVGNSSPRKLSITINEPVIKPSITTNSTLEASTKGEYYSETLKANGTTPITWEIFSGTLPYGLNLDKDSGTISGTPIGAGNFSFTVKATNSAGYDYKTFNITVDNPEKPKITTSNLPSAPAGKPYSAVIDFTGSKLHSVLCSNLPEGLEINDSGEITGTPTKPGKYTLNLTFSNSAGTAKKKIKLAVFDITSYSLPVGTTGKSYKGKFTVTGIKPSIWEISKGTLPPGLTFKAGKFSGKPTEANTYNFTLRVGDEDSYIEREYSIKINPVAPIIKTSSLPKGIIYTDFAANMTLKQGALPIKWSAQNLPEGLTINEDTGEITGVPVHVFKGSVAITAENIAGSATKNVKLNITAIKPNITNKALDPAAQNKYYNFTLGADGSPSFKWSWSGKIPDGLTLDKDSGTISGTPKQIGKFKINITVENEGGKKSKKFTLVVNNADSASNKDFEDFDSESESQESESLAQNNNNESESQNESISQEFTENNLILDSAALSLISNDNIMIAAVLPDINVEESGIYEFTVSLDKSVPENAKLIWHSFPDGKISDSEDDNTAIFFNDNGQEIFNVPEDFCVIVSAWFEAGKIYKPVIAVELTQAQ